DLRRVASRSWVDGTCRYIRWFLVTSEFIRASPMAGILSCGHKPQGELHLAFPSDCERRGASLTHCRASEAVWPDNGGRWHYPRTAPGRMPGIAGSQRSRQEHPDS